MSTLPLWLTSLQGPFVAPHSPSSNRRSWMSIVSVGSQSPGAPVWDVVADYLRRVKTARIDKLNTPKLKNVAGNPGIA